jgi:acyl-CoA synthetase (NDP forming)
MTSDILAKFRPLFDPRGVIVAGVSAHPGKFGFVAAHNILRHDYPGEVFLVNREGVDVLGRSTLASVDAVPEGAADLVFVCTPAHANPDLLRACAKKGIRAAFVTSAGYAEAGPQGRAAQDELVALAEELGIVMAGPNGQGVISTPSSLCAQIVAPYPPPGRIAVASQSGNFVSSFLNYAVASGVGVSRAVSAGNSAAVTVADYLDYFAADPETAVALAYVEGATDGRAMFETFRSVTARKPLVVVKGGATAGGARAAASHTGSLAGDDRIFDGMCRQAGVIRAATIEEAFDTAAAFATLPLPPGPRVFVLTTAGGWGVVTADAITKSRRLELLPLPDDLRAALDAKLPPRWSRNNPADLAGGETRDTVPECMDLVAAHPDIDAVVFLGLGIQSNQGRLEKTGRFWPDYGLERIVAYHERQDRRFADAAVDAAQRYAKPVLVASELAVTHPDNAGVVRLRERKAMCFASSYRAVRSLEHLVTYAEFRRRRGIQL